MREADRLAGLQEDVELVFETGIVLVQPVLEGSALNQFQHEIGCARLGLAAVVEARDAGVSERGQGLALDREAPDQCVREKARLDQLDRHFAFEIAGVAPRAVHRAHAAAAYQSGDPVRADPFGRFLADLGADRRTARRQDQAALGAQQ